MYIFVFSLNMRSIANKGETSELVDLLMPQNFLYCRWVRLRQKSLRSKRGRGKDSTDRFGRKESIQQGGWTSFSACSQQSSLIIRGHNSYINTRPPRIRGFISKEEFDSNPAEDGKKFPLHQTHTSPFRTLAVPSELHQ